MSSKTKATIDTACAALERAAQEHGIDANNLFDKAYDAALESEKKHRRFGAFAPTRYRESAVTAARYFVCKWFVDPGKVTNAKEAALLRLDCLYASALRLELEKLWMPGSPFRNALEPIFAIDYCNDIVGAR